MTRPDDAPQLDLVRREVHDVLSRSPAYERLDPEQRRDVAHAMVKVGSYLAQDPGWLESGSQSAGPGTAEALGPVDDLKKRLAKAPGQVGQDFGAGAVEAGVQQFGNLVETVDFPEFVSGLIQGVFQAIVDASIQQMQAYAELLAAVSKSVDQFAQDHITDDQAREQLAGRFPSIVRVERSSEGGARLAPTEGAQENEETSQRQLQDFSKTNETIDFTDPESERKFLTAAKLEMARQRQKLMAMMVLQGINRIIVTNGRINAKVVFDMRASDYAQRMAKAGMTDRLRDESGGVMGAQIGPWGGGGYKRSVHMATVRSSIDDTSESKASVKAQLSGDVRVNFRSETLPPERMLDQLQYEQMNYLAGPGVGTPAPQQQQQQPATAGGAR